MCAAACWASCRAWRAFFWLQCCLISLALNYSTPRQSSQHPPVLLNPIQRESPSAGQLGKCIRAAWWVPPPADQDLQQGQWPLSRHVCLLCSQGPHGCTVGRRPAAAVTVQFWARLDGGTQRTWTIVQAELVEAIFAVIMYRCGVQVVFVCVWGSCRMWKSGFDLGPRLPCQPCILATYSILSPGHGPLGGLAIAPDGGIVLNAGIIQEAQPADVMCTACRWRRPSLVWQMQECFSFLEQFYLQSFVWDFCVLLLAGLWTQFPLRTSLTAGRWLMNCNPARDL